MDKEQPTIKERLTDRFLAAREVVGPSWKRALANSNAFFDTKAGADYMNQAVSSILEPRRISNDRLERVVIALERLVEELKPQDA